MRIKNLSYSYLNTDPENLKFETNDDRIKEINFKTDKNEYVDVLKSLRINNDYQN